MIIEVAVLFLLLFFASLRSSAIFNSQLKIFNHTNNLSCIRIKIFSALECILFCYTILFEYTIVCQHTHVFYYLFSCFLTSRLSAF